MTKNIRLLLILKDYPPNPSPNGVLTNKLILSLKKMYDVETDVITARINKELPWQEENEGIRIFRIPTYYEMYTERTEAYINYRGFFLFKQFFRLYLRIYRERINRSKNYAQMSNKKAISKAKQLHAENRYDCVMSVSHQFFPHFAALKFKKHDKSLKWLVYMMDPHADNNIKRDSLKKKIKEENRVFKNCDHILTTKEIFTSPKYSPMPKYSKKVSILFGTNFYDKTCEKKKSGNEINVLFAGLCDRNRSPEYLLKLWDLMPNNFRLHMYARGMEDIIGSYTEKLAQKLIFYGYVPYKEVEEAQKKADIFINIGNSVSNMVPSKIFDYMSYGRPIINIYSIDDDSVNPYFNKYPLALLIRADEKILEKNAKKLTEFCIENKNNCVSFKEASEKLKEYTLKNITEKIYNLMKDN